MNRFEHISFAARTDVGRKRKNNEDAFGTFPDAGIFCVADGMGGGDDGEIASAAVIKAVEDVAKACPFSEEGAYSAADVAEVLEDGLTKASSWVFNRAAEKKLSGCGSTFVGVVLDPTKPDAALAVHAGDSRLYLLHRRSIKQITRDHSAAEMIGAKDESKVNPMFRGMVMNAIGIRQRADLERTQFTIAKGDRILICSDGLSRMVPDKKILSISRSHEKVGEAVDALIKAALEAGGVDNVTVVLVEIGELPAAVQSIPLPSGAVGFADDDADTQVTGGGSEEETEDGMTRQTIMPTLIPTEDPTPTDQSRPTQNTEESGWKNAAGNRGRKASGRVLGIGVAVAALLFAAIVAAGLVAKRRGAETNDMEEVNSVRSSELQPVSSVTALPQSEPTLAPPDIQTPSPAPETILPPPPPPEEPATDSAAVESADQTQAGNETPVPPTQEPSEPAPPEEASSEQEPSPDEAHPEPETIEEEVAVDPVVAPVVEPRVEDSVCRAFVDSCEVASLDAFFSAMRRLFPPDDSHYDYSKLIEDFKKKAQTCRNAPTYKTVCIAVVDLKFSLQYAETARDALVELVGDGEYKAVLEDWDAVANGDHKDTAMHEACARLISRLPEVVAR